MKRLAVLAVLALALPARAGANVWDDAIERGTPDPMKDKYEKDLADGDAFALQANSKGASMQQVKSSVRKAAESYKAASLAKPDLAEPYYRLGMLIYSFYFECSVTLLQFAPANSSVLCSPDPRAFDKNRALEVIAAWDEFEKRAPLDPRLSVGAVGDSEILFRRAILHTKLATTEHLKAATQDYEKILARADDDADESIWSNLAETYMMIGRLDDAIDTYREALRRGPKTSTLYGLAVALDRDERGAQARDLILSQGETSRDQFHRDHARQQVFFVPAGEEYYYFALVDEAFGSYDTALDYWQRYVRSGAHPEFQPRAKQHIDALQVKRKKAPIKLPLPLPEELFR